MNEGGSCWGLFLRLPFSKRREKVGRLNLCVIDNGTKSSLQGSADSHLFVGTRMKEEREPLEGICIFHGKFDNLLH